MRLDRARAPAGRPRAPDRRARLDWRDVVFGFLAVTGFSSEAPGKVAASYLALGIFVVPLLLMFGLTTLGSGLALSIGSGWGGIRYW